MTSTEKKSNNFKKLAVIIPAYCESKNILEVLKSIPDFIWAIIVVNDASTDDTEQIVLSYQTKDPRIHYISHDTNQGVGGATITGYKKALDLDADILVKMDGDGQMSAKHLKKLLHPLLNLEADYTKGNRFFHIDDLKQMPKLRLLGNSFLGFLVRFCSGYWNLYDPTNGYTAVHANVLRKLKLDQIQRNYFFETDMLIELNIIHAKIIDIPIPSKYADEESTMSLSLIVLTFPFLLFKGFLKRIFFNHILYNFTHVGLFFIAGIFPFVFGLIFGTMKWMESFLTQIPATSGTVMLSAFTISIGFLMLLCGLIVDIYMVPQVPLIINLMDEEQQY